MELSFENIGLEEYFDHLQGEELERFHTDAVRSVLTRVNTYSPYYRRLFKDIGFNPEHFTDLSQLHNIPFTDKSHLHEFNMEFLNTDRDQIAEFVTTSGTLGRPVQVMLTGADLKRLAYNEARGLSVAGVGKGDIIQITTTLDRRFMAGLAYYLGSHLLGAATIRVGIGAPQLQWETIYDMMPNVLIGVPSFIVKLIEFAILKGIKPGDSSVRKIICIGEPIRESNLEWNKVGQYIRNHWDVELYSTYASTEMGTAFTECSHGRGGHQLNELIYTEVIGEDDRPVVAGETGELVITTLQMEGMPLVRFRTGDLVRRLEEPCTCGRTSARISPVIGRKSQMIKYKGTTVFPSAIQQILDHLPEVETYVIELASDEFGHDRINVMLAIKGEIEGTLNHIRELCKAHIRVTPELMVREASFISHLRNRPEMRKPMVVLDNRLKAHS